MSSEPMPSIKTHLSAGSTWLRGLFIVLFAIIFGIAEFILTAMAVFQFVCALLTGRPNARLAAFGDELGHFFRQLVRYLTFESDQRPFPFADWPRGGSPRHAADARDDIAGD